MLLIGQEATSNHFHNILRLFDVLANFPFTRSEMILIITYKHGIYELPHELPNELAYKDLRRLGNIRKVLKLHSIIAQCPVSPLK